MERRKREENIRQNAYNIQLKILCDNKVSVLPWISDTSLAVFCLEKLRALCRTFLDLIHRTILHLCHFALLCECLYIPAVC